MCCLVKLNSTPPIPVDLITRDGLAYSGPVYLGGTQYGNVVYDTGSGWLTVTSANCDSTCTSKVYNMSESTTGKVVGADFTLSVRL